MKQIIECKICEGQHDMMREHCPFCGARKIILGSHSYEPQRSYIVYRDSTAMTTELVRAFRSNIAFNFVSE
jgi:hypothetical protein